MFSFFQQISGIIAIIFAFGFVILPAYVAGIDLKKQTVSTATARKKYQRFINTGLVFGGFAQIVFLSYLIRKYSLSPFSLESFLFLFVVSISIFVAIFSVQKYQKIHVSLAAIYYILNPLAEVFVGYSIRQIYFNLYLITLVLVSINCLGLLYLLLRYRKGNVIIQSWGLFWPAIWTLVMTFY